MIWDYLNNFPFIFDILYFMIHWEIFNVEKNWAWTKLNDLEIYSIVVDAAKI